MTKILVVDNEKDICDFVVGFFKERHFEAFSAMRGHDALEIIKEKRPDIILLEMKIEDMSGIEILKRIKNIDSHAKVIVVSYIDNAEIIENIKRLGVEAYLTKPVSLSELMETVLRNIGRQRRLFKLKDDMGEAIGEE